MKLLRLPTFYLLCLAVSLSFLADITQAEDTAKTRAAKTQPLQSAHYIQFANDLLSVKLQDVSLREVLQEIARQGGLTLVPSGSLEYRITAEFHQLPLEEALRRILRQRSFAVEYSQQRPEESPSTVPQPKTLWILSKAEKAYPVQTTVIDDNGVGHYLQDEATDISTLEAALWSDDSWEREEAVEALGESKRPEAVAPLSLALEDEDEDVREAAIASLAEIGGDAAAEALAIALQDRDSSIREEAVEALGEIRGESVIRLLKQALADEDESVQDTAADMLAELQDQIR